MLPFQVDEDEDSEQLAPLLLREGVRDFRPRRTRGWSTLGQKR